MTKSKKFLQLLVAIILAIATFSFGGCKNNNPSSGGGNNPPSGEISSTPPAEIQGVFTETTLVALSNYLTLSLNVDSGLFAEMKLAEAEEGYSEMITKCKTVNGTFLCSAESTEGYSYYYDGTYTYSNETNEESGTIIKSKTTMTKEDFLNYDILPSYFSLSDILYEIGEFSTVKYYIDETVEGTKIIKIVETINDTADENNQEISNMEYFIKYETVEETLTISSIWYYRDCYFKETFDGEVYEEQIIESCLTKTYDGEVTLPNDLNTYVEI